MSKDIKEKKEWKEDIIDEFWGKWEYKLDGDKRDIHVGEWGLTGEVLRK